ncbi:MAG TPA: hypothetical protein DEG28_00535, partial [Porphyromonadaceae bacterium]|nr:hypothetical protein [Porphyromonadaceae bacterium]
MATVPFLGFAQEWDDIYADPSQERIVPEQEKQAIPQKKVVVIQGDVSGMKITANGRNVDEYNRRDADNVSEPDTLSNDSTYQPYEYTDRIIRFHDPESSIKITGADEVIIFANDDIYDDYYRNRYSNTNVYFGTGWGWGFNSYYPWYNSWYDPWYYGGWYSPWSYSRWYSPWYYGGYSSWYSPWYYSSWYDPWYYGGYGYGGGYY